MTRRELRYTLYVHILQPASPVVFLQKRQLEVAGAALHVVAHLGVGAAVADRLADLPHHGVPDDPVHAVVKVPEGELSIGLDSSLT